MKRLTTILLIFVMVLSCISVSADGQGVKITSHYDGQKINGGEEVTITWESKPSEYRYLLEIIPPYSNNAATTLDTCENHHFLHKGYFSVDGKYIFRVTTMLNKKPVGSPDEITVYVSSSVAKAEIAEIPNSNMVDASKDLVINILNMTSDADYEFSIIGLVDPINITKNSYTVKAGTLQADTMYTVFVETFINGKKTGVDMGSFQTLPKEYEGMSESTGTGTSASTPDSGASSGISTPSSGNTPSAEDKDRLTFKKFGLTNTEDTLTTYYTVEGEGFDHVKMEVKNASGKVLIENELYDTAYAMNFRMDNVLESPTYTMNLSLYDVNGKKVSSAQSNLQTKNPQNPDGSYSYDKTHIFTIPPQFLCSDWAKDEVMKAAIYGVVPTEMYIYDLTEEITRAEFTGIAVSLLESIKGKADTSSYCPFIDIFTTIYTNYIVKAYNLSLTTGISEFEFGANEKMTREQLATMLCRVIKAVAFRDYNIADDNMYNLNTGWMQTFEDDNLISPYASESVYFMSHNGITKGVDSTHFAPQSTATRQEAILLAKRIYDSYKALAQNVSRR